MKPSSYKMNGAVSGDSRKGLAPEGRTYKTSDFRPSDIMIWETSELDAFNFRDAGANPENRMELLTQRHGAQNGEGTGSVGRGGSSADFARWSALDKLATKAAPNDLLCGPAYR